MSIHHRMMPDRVVDQTFRDFGTAKGLLESIVEFLRDDTLTGETRERYQEYLIARADVKLADWRSATPPVLKERV